MSPKSLSTNKLSVEETNKLFCVMGKKYGIKKLLLKAIATRESSLDERAFRYEPDYWPRHKDWILKSWPELAGRDVAELSSSYGLMQILFVTAWALGFRGTGEELYDPTTNVMLGAKLINQLISKVRASGVISKFPFLSDWEIVLCNYNGGAKGNPDDKGKLRNQAYADKVMRLFYELKSREKECDE